MSSASSPPAHRASSVDHAVVVIPALAPGPELLELVTALREEGIDVVVLDDGSGLDYKVVFDRCEQLGALVGRLPDNRGKGNALREAFALVQEHFPGRGAVTADADGQHTLADIRRVIAALEPGAAEPGGNKPGAAGGNEPGAAGGNEPGAAGGNEPGAAGRRSASDGRSASGGRSASDGRPTGAGLVLGVRCFARGAVPLRSWFGNAVSALLFRAVAGERVEDTQTGLRGIPAEHLAWVQTLPGDRYEYEYTMLVRAARDGIGIVQIPIATVYLDDNASSHFRPVRDSLRVLAPVLGFAASGLTCFALDTALFLTIAGLGGPVWAALASARLLSGGLNFSLNRWAVFRGGRRTPLLRSFLQYAALAAVVLVGGIVLVNALVAMGVPLLGAKIGADLLLFALSYVVQRLVVFRGR
ncbi:GtrA family protein [Brachybacterium sp. DNPG3]